MGKSICILLVDDHDDSTAVMARVLRINGYTVHTASRAAEAKEVAAAHRCDLVIGDIGLPDQSGYELMRELRDAYGLKGIAVTGYSGAQAAIDARAAGFDKYLAKPVSYSELLQAVNELAP